MTVHVNKNLSHPHSDIFCLHPAFSFQHFALDQTLIYRTIGLGVATASREWHLRGTPTSDQTFKSQACYKYAKAKTKFVEK